MTRGSNDARVKVINDKLVIMTNLVEKQIYKSIVSLKLCDTEAADKIIKDDDKVDALQKELEDACIKYIAAEQPLATDLRRVFTASKIVTDLERMADHAVDICKVVKRIKNKINEKDETFTLLWDMAEKVRDMVKMSVDAYLDENKDEAYRICSLDDSVDKDYKELFSALVQKIKDDNVSFSDNGTQLLFVIKYLERIADHVTNICEWTIFLNSGSYVDLNE